MSIVGGPGEQQSITAAIEAAQNAAEADGAADGPQDSRVVESAPTCHCGRPAGADGLCTAHQMEHRGGAIDGRRL